MGGLNTVRGDHSTIGTMLEVLEVSVDRLKQGRYVDPQMLSGILRFFEQFVGKCHYAQEETALFPLLTSNEQAAPMLRTLMRQHACQREALGLVADALGRDRSEGRALDALAFHVRAFSASVRAHLFIEDPFFTDIAAAILTPDRDEDLLREFICIERNVIGATGREWYNQLVADYKDITSTWGPLAGYPRSGAAKPGRTRPRVEPMRVRSEEGPPYGRQAQESSRGTTSGSTGDETTGSDST